jgi:hypothetical protein
VLGIPWQQRLFGITATLRFIFLLELTRNHFADRIIKASVEEENGYLTDDDIGRLCRDTESGRGTWGLIICCALAM